MSNNIIEVNNLTKYYGNKLALNDCSLKVKKGKVIGLLGPNGSGKSTLIKLINGLLTPNSGEILINGLNIGVETKKIVSYLPERTYLDPSSNVLFLLNFFQDFYEDFDIEKAKKILESFEIDLDLDIKSLSKGMKEKVQLSLVMSRNAKLYILDEPIAGVDPASREFILRTILTSLPSDATLILSTHLIYEIEDILEEIIVIKQGNIIFNGDKNVLIKDHESLDQWFRKEFRHEKTL